MHVLLILWSLLTSAVMFVMGLALAFSPYGATWPGAVLALSALGLGAVSVQTWREQSGWTRYRSVPRPTRARPAAFRTRRATEPRARSTRTTKVEWKSGSGQRATMA